MKLSNSPGHARAELLLATALLLAPIAQTQNQIHIDHRFSNTDAQSLIGLPLGSHKTTVDKQGNLKWSQWSLKRRPLDTPIGFSSQMDGELAINASADQQPFTMQSQTLYHERYPFIVSRLAAGSMSLEELTFAADPDAAPGVLPQATSGTHGLDMVRLTFTNGQSRSAHVALKLSGRERTLPGHVHGAALITNDGEDVALLTDVVGASITSQDHGLSLQLSFTLPANQSKTLWIRLPYEWPSAKNAEVSKDSGSTLLKKATAQWDGLWTQGAYFSLPQQELDDFYFASIAYVLLLTEYDAQGDLWALDGPAVYRQYWGRGEYFQARAMEVAGQMDVARRSVNHPLHIQNDDGEWDGPPTSGWPAWDNTGGNMAAAWDHYLYSRDKQWLASAYPHMLKAAEWIRAHREESTLEDVADIPAGARPIHRMIASKCRPEPNPPLQPGEKTYWYGLLPWSYGDSGLPEGHSFSHNFLADYGVEVTAQAALVLGQPNAAKWLDAEFASYTKAIQQSVNRAVTLEKTTPAYLPAMPTYPQGAYSQTFLAVYPTHLYSPNDPLISGLITRMEHEEMQGVPTNVAWAGPAGIWAGEAMNMAETYLLRGEKQKAADMMIAALNHSYTTKVWKEEILVDVTRPRACDTPHSKRENMEGTGDMPEAWANANYVNLLRDMLVLEQDGRLNLIAGLPSGWIQPGQQVSVRNAPTTLGGTVSYTLDYSNNHRMELSLTASKTMNFAIHIPIAGNQTVTAIRINGRPISAAAVLALADTEAAIVDIDLQ